MEELGGCKVDYMCILLLRTKVNAEDFCHAEGGRSINEPATSRANSLVVIFSKTFGSCDFFKCEAGSFVSR